MTTAKRWLLPDGVEEILPEEAYRLECLRRELLDRFESWGYELVIPPLIEFLDSLLVGSSHDLDPHTFKITDQLSGRMMGIRADITPQAARIDAHCLHREGAVRLCYADNVLHTKPRGLMNSRVPIRVGAELFGQAGAECDVELICLMNDCLQAAGIEDITLVLGHVGIFRSLVQEAGLGFKIERALFQAVQRKAFDEIADIIDDSVSDENMALLLRRLTELSGGEATLKEAMELFVDGPDTVQAELNELVAVAAAVRQRRPDSELHFDLCELRGYEYHTGIVFAAYCPQYGRAVAKGGRYDDIGEVFGRSRPASGFDTDLKVLAKLSARAFSRRMGILAPEQTDAQLQQLVDSLRDKGEIVISSLSSDEADTQTARQLGCDRVLVKKGDQWAVQSLPIG
jgi:ATP phosphoribosyltransferase regulatory subunit